MITDGDEGLIRSGNVPIQYVSTDMVTPVAHLRLALAFVDRNRAGVNLDSKDSSQKLLKLTRAYKAIEEALQKVMDV
jgi:hypothetical protein